MAIVPYLAMTAAEIQQICPLPPKIVWLSCHFSPDGKGLTLLPDDLPPKSLLILDDSIPINGHETQLVQDQLLQCIRRFDLDGILLDFQRPDSAEASSMAMELAQRLPCPVAVSELYASDQDIPVFLSPVPPSVPLSQWLSPWSGRTLWLDISPNPECLRLTPEGCESTFLPPCSQLPESAFWDATLHCHYHIRTSEGLAEFILWRTKEDLEALCQEAQDLGVARVVGLYQELNQWQT